MKKTKLIISILGAIALFALTIYSLNFYYSFDSQLQSKKWRLAIVTDSLGNLIPVVNHEVILEFKGRKEAMVYVDGCGEHQFQYLRTKGNVLFGQGYRMIKSCQDWDHPFYRFTPIFASVSNYKISNDTLGILSSEGNLCALVPYDGNTYEIEGIEDMKK